MSNNVIATVAGTGQSESDFAELADSLNAKLNRKPDLIIASYSSLCDTDFMVNTLASLYPEAAIAGASTCRGAITADGLHAFGESNVTLWGLCDDEGSYGVGFSSIETSVRQATEVAIEIALKHSGRPGELPALIWMHTSPGNEETVVATLDEIFEGDVSIVGGSAADEALEAKWSCFAGQEHASNGVSITLFFSSFEISTSFQSGYMPTEKSGIATRCDGRTVYEIDNRPAALVYNDWTDQLVDLEQTRLPVNVLGSSTLTPLGVAVGDVSGIPYYNLAHPETYTEEKALTFFCEVAEGEQLTLMNGTVDNIISRPGRVANEAILNSDDPDAEVLGGLVVFCGGCLLAVEPRAAEISGHLNENMQQRPYLGCFTFGEQGCLMGGENRHGNLMISVTVFKR